MHRLLADERIAPYDSLLGRNVVKRAADEVLGRARASGADYDAIVEELASSLESVRREMLHVVINATGVILNTNLGRSPIGPDALSAVLAIGRGYTNLEYDLHAGARGSRYVRVAAVLNAVTGAQDSLVVNNCAAAVLLVLDTFAKGREVIVARNQLVEIGGGFRVPDVLERSGATLIEVGTTNRVYIEDFERALSPRTALLLRTHASNYRIEGFTRDVTARELVGLGLRAGVPVVEDLGSGALVDLAAFGIGHERTVQEAIGDGVGLVTFSGDKLLGGPQAGIVAGREPLIAPLKNNPLLRALRVGKMTLAALEATLARYRDGSFGDRIPILRMLRTTLDDLQLRGRAYLERVAGTALVDSDAYLGGGSLPAERIASIAVAIESENADRLAARLREAMPLPVVGRVDRDRLLLDLRTIPPEQDGAVIATLNRVLTSR
jgi:L-seryl-tRNA(Ser) seleniumtransferase